MRKASLTFVFICQLLQTYASYIPLREYSGESFFDRWEFYGNVDNTTWGNVSFVDSQSARNKNLVYTNPKGNAIIKVDDHTTVPLSPLVHRDTIRITSIDSYTIGTLVIIDVIHIPYGCSVWPSFWAYGLQGKWPNAGEIDIIEGINGMETNQVTLHAPPGCMKTEIPGQQTGITIETNCSTVEGCTVKETKPNSYGPAFAQAAGGVFAMQFASSGIYFWFWSRPDIPTTIKNASPSSKIDTSIWGIPSAAYPSTGCDISHYFPPQNLVLLTTLCGSWAGVPSIYETSCNGSCIANNIVGSGSNYAKAYWEIKYIRTYYDDTVGPPKTGYPQVQLLPSGSQEIMPQFIVLLSCFILILGILLT